MKKNTYAVILAGGSGTRFWPASRKDMPKQFLSLVGQRTFLQETVHRVKSKVPAENVFVVTNENYRSIVNKQLKEYGVPFKNVLCEPSGKNTAPAICWVASLIHRQNPDAVMAIFPSDHLIRKQKNFLACLTKAVDLAKKEMLVTFGIVPTRPETGYGYLKTKKVKQLTVVDQFVEKPNEVKAKQYMKAGNYLWNSGMFVWTTQAILEEFECYQPKMFKQFDQAKTNTAVKKMWPKLESISIDYAIMERSQRVVAVSAKDIGWTDLGSWLALSEIADKDKQGNMIQADALAVGCRNVLIKGNKKFIAAVGLENITIVETDDAILVCQTEQSQDVREVVDYLKKTGRKEL